MLGMQPPQQGVFRYDKSPLIVWRMSQVGLLFVLEQLLVMSLPLSL